MDVTQEKLLAWRNEIYTFGSKVVDAHRRKCWKIH